jgi:hypothetical protein
LYRALPALGTWSCGLLAVVVYVASASASYPVGEHLPKVQQVLVLSAMMFAAIYRNDARVFWAMPVLLLFDLRGAAVRTHHRYGRHRRSVAP